MLKKSLRLLSTIFAVWSFQTGLAYSNQIKIIMLGDSLTAGYGIEKTASYPSILQEKLSKGNKSVEIINAGISGSTTASASSRLEWLLKANPTHLFLALGANDGLRGFKLDTTKKNLADAIQLAIQKKVKVLLVGMKIPPNYGVKYTMEFEQLYKDLAKKFSIPLLPFLLEGVAGERSLNIPDGIHPNEKGHQIIADNVEIFLKRNIKTLK